MNAEHWSALMTEVCRPLMYQAVTKSHKLILSLTEPAPTAPKMRLKLFGFLLAVACLCFGQETTCDITIDGKIVDIQSKQPISFATVKIGNTTKGTLTDANGNFSISDICPGDIDLEVSHVSYKSLTHHHDVYHSAPVIYLAPKEIELEGLVVEEDQDKTTLQSTSSKVESVSGVDKLSSSSGDLAGRISGVTTFRTGPNVAKPMVHGLHSNRVLIINNGIRHSYQAWGREHAPEIDAGSVDRIKVVKGAATVRYGSDALGGVILFDAERPTFDTRLGGELTLSGETNGRSFETNSRIRQGFHRFAWNAGLHTRNQGDLSAPDYQLTNTGAEELGADFHGLLHRETVDLSVYYSHFEQNLGILRGSVVGSLEDLVIAMREEPPRGTNKFSYDLNNPRQQTVHDLYKLKSSFFFSGYELNAHYAFQQNQRQEFDIRRGTNNDRPAIDLTLNSHEVDINLIYPAKTLKGMFGVQGYLQDNDNNPGTNTIPFVPNYNISNLGFYTVQSINSGNSTYEIGARYDYQYMNIRGRDSQNDIYRSELDYHNATFLLGYSNQLGPKWKFTTNLASAWRPPNIGELFAFGKHQFTVEYGLWTYSVNDQGEISAGTILNNDDKPVQSEQGVKWINELSYVSDKLQSELVVYYNHISNYFFSRPFGVTSTVRGVFPYFIWDQTNAQFLGADFDLRYQHSDEWQSEIRAAFVSAKDLSGDQFFLEIPPVNLSYSLTRQLDHWRYGLNLEYTATQTRSPAVITPESIIAEEAVIDPNIIFDLLEPPVGFFLIGTYLSYENQNWLLSLRLDNLLNQSYRTYTDRLRYFADNPGFNAQLGVQFKF